MFYCRLYVKLLYHVYLLSFASPARILGLFTMEAKSHFNFHEAIVKSLLAAGHRVTVVAPFATQNPHDNYTVMNFQNNRSKSAAKSLSEAARPNLSTFAIVSYMIDIMEEDCHHIISSLDVENLKNFDVLFVETMPMYRCYLPIAKKLEIPVIGTMSGRSLLHSDGSIGNPRFPSVFPIETIFTRIKMTFFDRIFNFAQELENRIASLREIPKLFELHQKFFPDQNPHPVYLSLLFVNNHASFLPRVTSPNSVNIGGIYIKTSSLKPLKWKLKKFIEDAKHGVILFSLGSVVSSNVLDPAVKTALINTFAKIPQRIIWKFDDQIEGLSENVLLQKWMPQKEVLAHENVLAFISHCGLGSTYEAIYFGKPMILLPVFGDQPGNAAVLSGLEVGIYIDISKLNEKNLLGAINEVLNNTKYRKNMESLSEKFKDEPMSPDQLVVYWTEYVIRHKGASHLRSADADMPLYKFLLLDIIIVFVAILTVSGCLSYFIGKRLLTLLSRWFKFVFDRNSKYKFHKVSVLLEKKKS